MTLAAPRRRISVFTRVPVPGAAKTRLVPPLTPAEAAALQRAMTEDLLDRLARSLDAGAPGLFSREVRCDREPVPGSLDIPARWVVVPQGPGDLGERLARAARAAQAEGLDRLVMIGSDAPLLPVPLVESAFSTLDTQDAVLAPAEDGGYVLVAVAVGRLPGPAIECLFSDIPWGTAEVGRATAEAAGRAGLRFSELPLYWDVDRPEDLLRLAAEIRALDAAERPRRTAALLSAVGC